MKLAVLKYFAEFIEKETGIVYADNNFFQLKKRLKEICQVLGVSGIVELRSKAQSEGIQGAFKQLLLDVATNNETSFFRDPKIFRAFEKHILPALIGQAPRPKVLRIWSAASSFGQEAYSIAMILQQIEESGENIPPCEIFASDISVRALERVNEAKYSQLEVQRGLPVSLLEKYFEKLSDGQWQLKSFIRLRVKSRRVNLLKISNVPWKFDVIFCRNALIYQGEVKKREIIQELTKFLLPGGYFLLGAAEILSGYSTDYEQISLDGAVFYKRKR